MNTASPVADLDQVRTAMDKQIMFCRASNAPFTANVIEAAGAGLANDGALARLVVPWPGNPIGDALPLRIAGALHLLVRSGRAPALARFYPGHGAAPWDATAFARDVEASVTANLTFVREVLASPPQTNEVGRSAILMPGYTEVANRTGLPLNVLELGASAGLNLNWDRYAYRYGEHVVGDPGAPLTINAEWRGPWCGVERLPRVAARRGCDQAPIDLQAEGAADRLVAYFWPDQAERFARVQAAIALAQREPHVVDKMDAAEWLERHLAKPTPGVATVVAHTIVSQYFTKATRARVREILDDAGARANAAAPLAWLSFEQYALDQLPELRLTLWPGGETRLIAHAHPHGAWIEWMASALAKSRAACASDATCIVIWPRSIFEPHRHAKGCPINAGWGLMRRVLLTAAAGALLFAAPAEAGKGWYLSIEAGIADPDAGRAEQADSLSFPLPPPILTPPGPGLPGGTLVFGPSILKKVSLASLPSERISATTSAWSLRRAAGPQSSQ